jgi:hypothetical protein
MANTTDSSLDQPTAGDAVATVREDAASVASAAGHEARGVARDTGVHVREVAGETREQLRRQASEQTERLARALREASEQLRNMGEGRAAPSGMVSDMALQLSTAAGTMAGRLDGGGLDTALHDVRRFARNRPAMFLLGATAAGFAVGRLMKAVDTSRLVESAKKAAQDGSTAVDLSPAAADFSSPARAGSGGAAQVGRPVPREVE